MTTQSTLVAGRYRLVEMRGAGDAEIEWQAHDERLDRAVALRILRVGSQLGDAERRAAVDSALRVARTAAGLQHPRAVPVLDVVEHNGQPCIVTEPIESETLSTVLERARISPAQSVRIASDVSSALAAAHAMRIVHGAVNPATVLVRPDGSAMIGDFGVWDALDGAAAPASGLIHGRSAYAAPEVTSGRSPRPASDVFSLGAMLYAMLEGVPPFAAQRPEGRQGETPRGDYLPPQNAGALAPLMRRMLALTAKRRPSMASVEKSLAALPADALTDSLPDPGTGETARARAVPILPAPIVAAAAVAESPPEPALEPDMPMPDAPTEVLADAAEPEEPADAPTEVIAPPAVHVPQRPPLPAIPAATAALQYSGTRTETVPLTGPTAVTERVEERTATGPSPDSAAHSRRRRGAGIVAGVLILLVALPVLAALLLNPLQPDLDQVAPTPRPSLSAAPRTATTDPDAGAAAQSSASPAPSAPPAQSNPSPAPSSPSVAPSAPSAPAPAPGTAPPSAGPVTSPAPSNPPAAEPPAAPTGQQLVDAILGYYALLPGDRESAWPLMTADYQQNHAGGPGGYEAFWSAITAVEVSDVSATPPEQAQATLTYHFADGRVVQEVTSFRLVDEGGVLKIADSTVLSSVEL